MGSDWVSVPLDRDKRVGPEGGHIVVADPWSDGCVMSLFERLGSAAKALGKEMNKGIWIAAIEQEAQSLDSRSVE